MEQQTLASELLHEVKAASRRWFIAFIIMVILEVVTIAGFIWYITLPSTEYEIEQISNDRSFNMINGGNNNGGISEDNI